jgi:hypothetical protein
MKSDLLRPQMEAELHRGIDPQLDIDSRLWIQQEKNEDGGMPDGRRQGVCKGWKIVLLGLCHACLAVWSTGGSTVCSEFTSTTALGQSSNFSKPQFPYLYNHCDHRNVPGLLRPESMYFRKLFPQNHQSKLGLKLNQFPSLIVSYLLAFESIMYLWVSYFTICFHKDRENICSFQHYLSKSLLNEWKHKCMHA